MNWTWVLITIIIAITFIVYTAGIQQHKPPDECAEKLYTEAMRYAALIPKGTNVSDAKQIIENNREKLIQRLNMAIRMYC